MSREAAITHKTGAKSILDLSSLYQNGHLNLEPGFQRQSVWNERDRAKLIDSILRNYPLPTIFLYRRQQGGNLVFDVIDGKQRLESVFMFIGAMRGRFGTRTQLPGADSVEWVDWSLLKRRGLQHLIAGYEIPVIEVDGEIGDIINVFVRINSTGKALTRQEQRHARYYNSAFLKEASRLANRFESYLLSNGVFSLGQLSRMKHIELMCELMLSMVQGDVLNKKTALDRVMATTSFDGRQLGKASRMVTTTLNRIRKMFPHLKTTRLRQVTDFYTLAVLIGKFEQEGMILTNRRLNQLAWDLLQTLAARVDEVRELQRKAKGARADQELYRDYLLTVSQGTDEVSQRRKREQILRGILGSLFSQKDSQRGFTSEQRRIIWNTAANRVCAKCSCKLTWEDFTIDHINPYSKGGRSQLTNAALMCRKHNSAKGNRRR
jgi:5-methylcytosine-specific restriction endonuclease McrA